MFVHAKPIANPTQSSQNTNPAHPNPFTHPTSHKSNEMEIIKNYIASQILEPYRAFWRTSIYLIKLFIH